VMSHALSIARAGATHQPVARQINP
jgi:hypothetical protein